jgi:hypothetical protein
MVAESLKGKQKMNRLFFLFALLTVFSIPTIIMADNNDRVSFNDQQLFLSGLNAAWENYARDFGPGILAGLPSDVCKCADITTGYKLDLRDPLYVIQHISGLRDGP